MRPGSTKPAFSTASIKRKNTFSQNGTTDTAMMFGNS